MRVEAVAGADPLACRSSSSCCAASCSWRSKVAPSRRPRSTVPGDLQQFETGRIGRERVDRPAQPGRQLRARPDDQRRRRPASRLGRAAWHSRAARRRAARSGRARPRPASPARRGTAPARCRPRPAATARAGAAAGQRAGRAPIACALTDHETPAERNSSAGRCRCYMISLRARLRRPRRDDDDARLRSARPCRAASSGPSRRSRRVCAERGLQAHAGAPAGARDPAGGAPGAGRLRRARPAARPRGWARSRRSPTARSISWSSTASPTGSSG